jgi:hypothetical protein
VVTYRRDSGSEIDLQLCSNTVKPRNTGPSKYPQYGTYTELTQNHAKSVFERYMLLEHFGKQNSNANFRMLVTLGRGGGG